MWPGRFDEVCAEWSFHHALPLLDSEPDAAPLLCVQFNEAWRPFICGALLQLLARLTWDQTDQDALYLQQERSYKLLTMFGLAEACQMEETGLSLLTIPAGDAFVSVPIVFTEVYLSAPVITLACDNGDLIASWSDVTLLGFTLTVTAATPVAVDTSGTVSWETNP